MKRSEISIEVKYLPDSMGVYKVIISNVFDYYIFKEPTGDCQSYTIANIGDIINTFPNDWVNVLVEIQKVINKNSLLINMRKDKSSYHKVIEFFSEDIIVNTEYTSTRDSYMSVLIIKTNKLDNIINSRNTEIQ